MRATAAVLTLTSGQTKPTMCSLTGHAACSRLTLICCTHLSTNKPLLYASRGCGDMLRSHSSVGWIHIWNPLYPKFGHVATFWCLHRNVYFFNLSQLLHFKNNKQSFRCWTQRYFHSLDLFVSELCPIFWPKCAWEIGLPISPIVSKLLGNVSTCGVEWLRIIATAVRTTPVGTAALATLDDKCSLRTF